MFDSLYQKTIACSLSVSGVGLHTGNNVKMKVLPAKENTGVIFRRVDLPNAPEIPAHYKYIDSTFMCTCLKSSFSVKTVEHFLAAASGLGLDNIIVEIDSEELPILDGSAKHFLFLLQSAGIVKQNAKKDYYKVKSEHRVVFKDGYILIKPCNGFKVNFQIDYEHPAFSNSIMNYSLDFSKSHFAYNLSMARTYGFTEDFDFLRDKGLIKGGGLDNALVFSDSKLLNAEGLRYADECVRHKILDVVGDLKLLGKPIHAELTCFKSGHTLNHMAVEFIAENS